MRKYQLHLLVLSVISIIGMMVFANNDIVAEGNELPVYDLKTVTADGAIPDFVWDENGKEVSFKEYTKGKVVFLNIWATWCPPCRKEVPDIVKISKKLKNKDFVVVGVSVDLGPTARKKVESFVKAQGINYVNILDVEKKLKSTMEINSYPTTIIIDKDGKIAEKIVGMQSYPAFMRSINRVL